MISVFVSYSHADEEMRRQLDTHLTSLKRQGIVDVWHDRRIPAGADFSKEIDAALSRADIVLLLVSPDFIASAYCYEVEMAEALRRHEQGEAVVIPVILRPCDWRGLPFGRLRATPTDGKPIRQFPDLDSAFLQVVHDVKAAATRLSGKEPAMSRGVPSPNVQPVRVRDEPKSGNLAIKRGFTDFERDQFRIDTYEYIARYFENSLAELASRNPEIRTSFRRLDPTAFEVSVYDAVGKIKGGAASGYRRVKVLAVRSRTRRQVSGTAGHTTRASRWPKTASRSAFSRRGCSGRRAVRPRGGY